MIPVDGVREKPESGKAMCEDAERAFDEVTDVVVNVSVKDLSCPVCLKVMPSPKLLLCGHRLGGCCMERMRKSTLETGTDGIRCPICSQVSPGNISVPDLATQNIVRSRRVTCPHPGCEHACELRDLLNHKRKCPCRPKKVSSRGIHKATCSSAFKKCTVKEGVRISMSGLLKTFLLAVTVSDPQKKQILALMNKYRNNPAKRGEDIQCKREWINELVNTVGEDTFASAYNRAVDEQVCSRVATPA